MTKFLISTIFHNTITMYLQLLPIIYRKMNLKRVFHRFYVFLAYLLQLNWKYLEIYATDHSKIFSLDSFTYKKHYLNVLNRYISEITRFKCFIIEKRTKFMILSLSKFWKLSFKRIKKHAHVGTPSRSETSFAVLHIFLAKF